VRASSGIQTKATEGVTRQISAESDGMWGGGRSYPGKPSGSDVGSCRKALENRLDEETPKRAGNRGWQIRTQH
jgi:hypothetical protein